MKKVILFSVLFLFITVTSTSFSQFKMDIGPAFGFNFNLHNGSDLQEGGTGFGIFFAGRSDMSFDRNRNLGVIFGLAFYDGRGGSSSTSGTDQYYGNYTQDNDVSIAYFQIETLFRYRLNSGLYFFFGPQLGFDETAELEQTTTVQGYQPQKTKTTIKETKTRFELKTGAGYDIPLSRLITLSPEFSFGLGLTDVIKDVKYKISTIQAGVVCKINVI
ncbi:MAG: outer membrane beta-barrel protein [Bacteroidetes bacterium]|nr:outer membrane beta-barrel protein [Bacteroidota bacterium]